MTGKTAGLNPWKNFKDMDRKDTFHPSLKGNTTKFKYCNMLFPRPGKVQSIFMNGSYSLSQPETRKVNNIQEGDRICELYDLGEVES